MNSLSNEKIKTLDSREVAKMMEKSHGAVMKGIQGSADGKSIGIIPTLLKSNFDISKYFVESTYKDASGKTNKCYQVTKMGCEMLGNKLQGEKGILFTAKYVQRFNQMEEKLKLPTTYKEALLQLVASVEEKEQLQLANKQKDQVIGELKPKADYLDSILKSTSLVTITQIAKDYGKSGTEMNKILHNLKVQYKQSGQWLLYSEHHAKGYTHSETIAITHNSGEKEVKMNTKWTQKGRLFLYELLKKNGILPLIERELLAC